MSHAEQLAFFEACVNANAGVIADAKILEIGSYDVNGSVRSLFRDARKYIGVDLTQGPGVDVIGYGHEMALGDESFDLAISAECFEHDPYWRETFTSMVRHVRPGGLVLVTCASRGRVEHGTTRSGATQSPGTESLGSDYYENVDKDTLNHIADLLQFSAHRAWYLPRSADLYFAGIKAGASSPFRLPSPEQVAAIASLMSPLDRLLRYPVRQLSKSPISEPKFQEIAIPYWRLVFAMTDTASRARTFLRNFTH